METLYLYVLLLGLAWSIFNKYFITKIKNLPPTPWSALTVIGFSTFFKQPIHKTLFHIAKRHGPILLLRFGIRRVLVISSASAAEDLFTKNDAAFADRPKLIPGKVFGCNYTSLAWAPYGDLWVHLRRVACLEMMPFHRLPEQNDSLADEVKRMLRQLYCNNKVPVKLKPMFLELVFNVMMRMLAGQSAFDSYRQPTEVGEHMSLLEYVSRSFKMTTGETDLEYFMPILKLLGVTDLEQRCRKLRSEGDPLMDNLMNQIKNSRLCRKEEKVIQFLLDKQKEKPTSYTDEIIKALVLVLVSAGTNTTAGTLEWAVSLLLNHPEVLQKAQKEIDTYVLQKTQKENNSNIGNCRFLEPADIEHLPYLRCIVKETMRLYPSAPLLVPHESSKDCNVGGYYVPKGTMLMLNVWAIHNDPKTWDEPTKFNPDRFVNIVDERDGFKLMPFGYARRSCPGKHMATRVITMVLGSLIHCFEWQRVCDEMEDLTEQMGQALLREKPLMAVCRPRSMMKNLLSQI